MHGMLGVQFEATNFPSKFGVPRRGHLVFTWPELAWSAISVGKGELSHLLRHGVFSGFEIVYRLALLFANLRQTSDGLLKRSSAYDGLDPSEKSAVSYFLGMTLTKLFAEHMLEVPWLMHLDVYRSRYSIQRVKKYRPDFFGLSSSREWVVLESKGRTGAFSSEALFRAKQQASSVSRIDGKSPVVRAGVVSHFDNDVLSVKLEDPPEIVEPFAIELTEAEFFEGYYRPFEVWLDTVQTRLLYLDERRIRSTRIDVSDATIGVLVDEQYPTDRDVLQLPIEMRRRQGKYLGRDGVYVELGDAWSPESMHQEPQERGE